MILSDPMDAEFDVRFEGIAELHQSDDPSTETGSLPSIRDPVELFWELDNQYYPGTVLSINPVGQYNIKYDDGEVETVNLKNETRIYHTDGMLNTLW